MRNLRQQRDWDKNRFGDGYLILKYSDGIRMNSINEMGLVLAHQKIYVFLFIILNYKILDDREDCLIQKIHANFLLSLCRLFLNLNCSIIILSAHTSIQFASKSCSADLSDASKYKAKTILFLIPSV